MMGGVPAPLPDAVVVGPITLRRRRRSDVADLSAAIERSITELSAFLRWAVDGVPPPAELERAVDERDAAFEAGTGFEYVLRDTATGEIVGEAGGDRRAPGAIELGCWVRSDRTGRGYATAALRVLTSCSFDAFRDVERVEIRMDAGNVRSQAVAGRLGFEHIGDESFADTPLAGQTGRGHVYAMTRAGWSRSGRASRRRGGGK
jgi:RimJ/RimL family protein N-acetyltransferase